MLLAWTTTATREDAERLANEAVRAGLAACIQIDGPVTSVFRWEGKIDRAEEYRLLFKFLPEQAASLGAWIEAHHPYETPEWVVCEASQVSEKYLSWARANHSK